MQNWKNYLNSEPLPGLLDPEDPSVRYWTLIDILNRPICDSEVQEVRAAIAQ